VVPQLEAEAEVKAPKKELLNEGAIANKEQRKADWAIMREMAKYLWPKVMRSEMYTRE
jgi:ABC transporter ATM